MPFGRHRGGCGSSAGVMPWGFSLQDGWRGALPLRLGAPRGPPGSTARAAAAALPRPSAPRPPAAPTPSWRAK